MAKKGVVKKTRIGKIKLFILYFETHLCAVPFLRNVGFDGSIIVDVDGHVKHQCEVQQREQHVHRNPKQILAVGAWR